MACEPANILHLPKYQIQGTKVEEHDLHFLNRHQFARHLSAIQNGNQRGIYEQQALSRRIQD